jgi:hypothetical protein
MMKYNPEYHHRRSIRLQGYDYSQTGIYFVTICRHWFSLIVVLKTLPDKGLTENTKLKKLFPS